MCLQEYAVTGFVRCIKTSMLSEIVHAGLCCDTWAVSLRKRHQTHLEIEALLAATVSEMYLGAI